MQITLNVNKVYDCDVLVCGGGVSGIATAISAGKVFINGREICSPSFGVKEEDVISFRGEGKARLKEIGGLTKKGRISVTLERYQ